jgi:hypothetical protein
MLNQSFSSLHSDREKIETFQKTPTTNGTEYKSLEYPHKLLNCCIVDMFIITTNQLAHHLAICHMCLLMLLMHQEILLKIYALYLSSTSPTLKAQKLATSLFM